LKGVSLFGPPGISPEINYAGGLVRGLDVCRWCGSSFC